MTPQLRETCRQLRLSGLAASLDLRVQEAASHQLPHLQFLELLLQDELTVRAQRRRGAGPRHRALAAPAAPAPHSSAAARIGPA